MTSVVCSCGATGPANSSILGAVHIARRAGWLVLVVYPGGARRIVATCPDCRAAAAAPGGAA